MATGSSAWKESQSGCGAPRRLVSGHALSLSPPHPGYLTPSLAPSLSDTLSQRSPSVSIRNGARGQDDASAVASSRSGRSCGGGPAAEAAALQPRHKISNFVGFCRAQSTAASIATLAGGEWRAGAHLNQDNGQDGMYILPHQVGAWE